MTSRPLLFLLGCFALPQTHAQSVQPDFYFAEDLYHAAELRWLGDRTVMILARSGFSMRWRHWLGRFEYNGDVFFEKFLKPIDASGWLVDPLVGEEDAFMFSRVAKKGGGVYKVEVDRNGQVDDDSFRTKFRLNGRMTDGIYWYSDRAGQLRFAVREGKDDHYDLWLREKNRWKKVYGISGQSRFRPVTYFPERRQLLVLTDDENDKRVARELDVTTGQFSPTLYEHPTLDLSNLILNPADGRPVGIEYTRHGRVRRDYFVADQTNWLVAVSEHYPEQTTYVMSRDAKDQFAVVLVESSSHRGTLVYRDGPGGELIEIGNLAPQLDAVPMANTHVVKATSADGFEIEGYLTLPKKEEILPLLVVSHGGPIGIRDANHFDHETQYFAALGLAVLRTNYRGSSGFGRRFEEAGKGEWGRGIEDDIDLLVDHVIANHSIDEKRICAHGSSYGGYSAMMNIIRRPDRYRCASSLAGPTDLPLMFTSSDWSQDDELVAKMKEILGDPKTDLAAIKEVSPLYRATDLTRPMFLAHGEYDRRVDIEHLHRMEKVMNLLERPIETMAIAMGHGFSMRSDSRDYYRELSRFLIEQLNLEATILPPLKAPEENAPAEADSDETSG